MKPICIIYLFILLSVPLSIQAQYSFNEANTQQFSPNYLPDDTTSAKPIWIVKSMLQDEGKLWTSPFRMKKKDLLLWIPVFTATAISIRYDENIYSNIKDYQSKHQWVSDVSPVITYGGDNAFVLSAGGLFYLNGLIFKNQKAKQTGMIALQALAHAGFIVRVGKLIAGRQRPSYKENPNDKNGIDKWHWFPASLGTPMSKYDAFPSGHTIAAWTLATVIAQQYKDKKIIPILAYTYATGVGISRITEDTHWLSDVILGGAMGFGIGKFMTREHAQTKWTLFPTSSKKNVMLTAIYTF